MRNIVKVSALSAGFVFIAGFSLWPPGAVYWEALSAVVGPVMTLAIVIGFAAVLGGTFAWATDVDVLSFVLGGLVAYAGWMVAIELTMTPDSPVHFILYGLLLICMTAGAVLWDLRVSITSLRVPVQR